MNDILIYVIESALKIGLQDLKKNLQEDKIKELINLAYSDVADAHFKSAHAALDDAASSSRPERELNRMVTSLSEAYHLMKIAYDRKIESRSGLSEFLKFFSDEEIGPMIFEDFDKRVIVLGLITHAYLQFEEQKLVAKYLRHMGEEIEALKEFGQTKVTERFITRSKRSMWTMAIPVYGQIRLARNIWKAMNDSIGNAVSSRIDYWAVDRRVQAVSNLRTHLQIEAELKWPKGLDPDC